MAWLIADAELQPGSPITSSLMFRLRNGGVEPGAIAIFHQAAAPLEWTKLTDIDNRTLRVFSGAPSDGGSVNFSDLFKSGYATDGHVLTQSQIPSHNHGAGSLAADLDGDHTHKFYTDVAGAGIVLADNITTSSSNSPGQGRNDWIETTGAHTHSVSGATSNTGGNGSHSHTINLAVRHIGVIRCQKDTS